MSFDRGMVRQAWRLIVACQTDLGRTLSDGERRDLLMDNTPWDYETIKAVVAHVATVPCRANNR